MATAFAMVTVASAQTPTRKTDAADDALRACLLSASNRHPSIVRGRSSPLPRLLAFCRAEDEAYRQECQDAGHQPFVCWTNTHAFARDVLFGHR